MDLAEIILAGITEDEKTARYVHLDTCDSITNDYGGIPLGPCNCGMPERILAGCWSRRTIVEMHRGAHECPTAESSCGWCVDGNECETLQALRPMRSANRKPT